MALRKLVEKSYQVGEHDGCEAYKKNFWLELTERIKKDEIARLVNYEPKETSIGWIGVGEWEANSDGYPIYIKIEQYHRAGNPPMAVGAKVDLEYYEGTNLEDVASLQKIIQETLKE